MDLLCCLYCPASTRRLTDKAFLFHCSFSKYLNKSSLIFFPFIFITLKQQWYFPPSPTALQHYKSCTDRSLGLYLDLDFPDTRIYISISQESQTSRPQIPAQAQVYCNFLFKSAKTCNIPKYSSLTMVGEGKLNKYVPSHAGSQTQNICLCKFATVLSLP